MNLRSEQGVVILFLSFFFQTRGGLFDFTLLGGNLHHFKVGGDGHLEEARSILYFWGIMYI